MKNEQANITKEGLSMLMGKYIKLRGDYEKLKEENKKLKAELEKIKKRVKEHTTYSVKAEFIKKFGE